MGLPNKWFLSRVFAIATGLFASTSGTLVAQIGTSGPTLETNRIYRSAYYLGRGDTGIANADNEEAVFYNPAGLARGKGIYKKTVFASPHLEFSQATKDLTRRLAAEQADPAATIRENIGKPNHLGLYNFSGILLRRAAIGVIASSGVNLLTRKSPDSGGLETIEADAVQNGGVTFSLAEQFLSGDLMLGFTGKYLMRGRGALSVSVAEAEQAQESLSDTGDFIGMGRGSGGDLGLIYNLGGRSNTAFGVTVENIGDMAITPEQQTSLDLDLKQTVNIGFSMEPGSQFSKFRILADYRDAMSRVESNTLKKIHLGAELTVRDFIGFTSGLNQGYPTFGVYFDSRVLRMDLGMYTQEMGSRVGTRPDSRAYFRMTLGL